MTRLRITTPRRRPILPAVGLIAAAPTIPATAPQGPQEPVWRDAAAGTDGTASVAASPVGDPVGPVATGVAGLESIPPAPCPLCAAEGCGRIARHGGDRFGVAGKICKYCCSLLRNRVRQARRVAKGPVPCGVCGSLAGFMRPAESIPARYRMVVGGVEVRACHECRYSPKGPKSPPKPAPAPKPPPPAPGVAAPCALCATTGGHVRPGTRRPVRFRVEAGGRAYGLCTACRWESDGVDLAALAGSAPPASPVVACVVPAVAIEPHISAAEVLRLAGEIRRGEWATEGVAAWVEPRFDSPRGDARAAEAEAEKRRADVRAEVEAALAREASRAAWATELAAAVAVCALDVDRVPAARGPATPVRGPGLSWRGRKANRFLHDGRREEGGAG